MNEKARIDERSELLRSLSIDRREDAGELKGRERNGRWRIGALAACIAGAGCAGLWLAIPGAKQVDAAVPPVPQLEVAVEPVVPPTPQHVSSLVASGYVVARRKATIAAEIAGKVSEQLVEEGMSVSEGQVLARLDSVLATNDLELAKSREKAAVAAAQAVAADLDDAERILGRFRSLSHQNVVSEAEFTKTEAHAAVLRAQLAQAEAQAVSSHLEVQRASEVVAKHQIRAPFDGVVVERMAQPGEVISPASSGGFTRTGICTIVDMASIEIEVDVNEAFIGRVKPGGGVSAELDAYPGWTISGSVIAIVPSANREKGTVKVRISLKLKDPRILPDMAAKVTFSDSGEVVSAAHSGVTGEEQQP